MNSFDISASFLRYYQGLGYELLPSASLLDPSIPMTYVMSAGLVQVESSVNRLGVVNGDCYVLCQKCFRHFDLESVGKSPVHLSLFEMPGAFTFNADGRATTIGRMWELVTRVLGIDAKRMWVTYFGGGNKGGHEFPPDTETLESWQRIGIPSSRIIALGPGDNFWVQGGGIEGHEPTRKCGPNTELFFDRGEQWRCGVECRPGCRCGRFVEFANSLFIFAEVQEETGALRLMDRPFNETVIGTERVAMILQRKGSVFDIDCLAPLVTIVQTFSNGLGEEVSRERARHIISDYTRALLFLVADGAPPPGKGGRQRIIKQLIRGLLTQQQLLGISDDVMLSRMIDMIVAMQGKRYSGLEAGGQRLLDYIAGERARFMRTLLRAYRQLDYWIDGGDRRLSTEQVVDLVKGYGLPLPLIEVRLRQRGLYCDGPVFQDALLKWQAQQLNQL